jgi:hypothetical protein
MICLILSYFFKNECLPKMNLVIVIGIMKLTIIYSSSEIGYQILTYLFVEK